MLTVASSALPMLPNGTLEMYIQKQKKQIMTTIVLMKGDDGHHDDDDNQALILRGV